MGNCIKGHIIRKVENYGPSGCLNHCGHQILYVLCFSIVHVFPMYTPRIKFILCI